MRKKRKYFYASTSHEEGVLNLTPLIDVVFVVLIAFILVAPLIEVDHVNLASATQTSEKDIQKKSFISIYVREDDSIWVNQQPISISELTKLLKEKQKRRPDQIPQLYHDRKACFGTYQIVKNAVEVAGFTEMDVILQGKG